jgi:integrase
MVAGQVLRHAARRIGWHGASPTTLLERGERRHVASTAKRRIFRGDELARTIAAREPYKTLFALAAITAARRSELLSLTWRDVDLGDEPGVRFAYQVDRTGRRQPLETDESGGAVPIPPSLAAILTGHKLRSR